MSLPRDLVANRRRGGNIEVGFESRSQMSCGPVRRRSLLNQGTFVLSMAAKNMSTMLTQVFPVALLTVLLLGPAGSGALAQELRLVPDGDVFDCVDFAVDLVLVDAGEPVFGYQVSLSYPAGSFEPRRFEVENQDWSVRRSGRFPFAPASPCEPWADGDATDRILIAATVYPDPGMVDRPVADAAEGVELVLGRIIFRSMRGSAGGVLSASASDCAGSPVSFPTAFFNADGQTRTVHSEALVVPVLRTEVEDLSCSIVESVVELRWSAQPALESVRIDRDGETIATASATACSGSASAARSRTASCCASMT